MRWFILSYLILTVLAKDTSACDISFRDAVQLIYATETIPNAGVGEAVSVVGAEVECTTLGSFTIVRHSTGAMHVLDPRRIFNRWSRTGVAIGSPSMTLRSYFYVYMHSEPLSLWREFGRGNFSKDELNSMNTGLGDAPQWGKIQLPDATRYRSAMTEMVSAEDEQTIRLFLIGRSREYIGANTDGTFEAVTLSTKKIAKYAPDIQAVVSYKMRNGSTKHLILRVPINPEVAPYVGYPINDRGGDDSVPGSLIRRNR